LSRSLPRSLNNSVWRSFVCALRLRRIRARFEISASGQFPTKIPRLPPLGETRKLGTGCDWGLRYDNCRA
jgi:hypothetical protein